MDSQLETDSILFSPEILSSSDLAKLITEIYTVAGARIGSYFVEANIVLTLAGARGQTEFFIKDPSENDILIINKLDRILNPRDISLNAGQILKRYDQSSYLMIGINNLAGYELVSGQTRIPGVTKFEASTGFAGLDKWKTTTLKHLKREIISGNIKYPLTDLTDIFAGIVKGYPDTAIFDAIDHWGKGERQTPITDSNISEVKLYGGASPNFIFHPDHSNDPSIRASIKLWEKILRDFYKHPGHQQLASDSNFQSARLVR